MYKKIVTFGRNNYKTMKKFAFIIFIFLPILSFAQKKNHFGIKAGYISSRINHKAFNSDFNYSPRNLFTLGFAYNRSLGKVLDFQIESIYSFKGYQHKASEAIYSYNTSYVEIPVLLKVHTTTKLKPFLNAGFSPSFKMSDNYNTFKAFDLGLIGSIGIDIPLSENIYTFLELRGNLGLLKTHTPITSKSDYSTSSLYLITGLFF
jgi:hypothetical protein